MTLIVVFLFFFASTEQVFDQHCAACHGVDARGTAKGPGLATNPRVAQMSIAELSVFLEHGNPANGMPAFADLGTKELTSLAHYLKVLNMGTVAGPMTAEPTRKIS